MIPPQKFIRLPRSLRLRKAAKIAGEAEQLFIVSGYLPKEEAEYLGMILELLAGDESFAPEISTALKTARMDLKSPDSDKGKIRRVLNTVHYILMAETGLYQSDWDLVESSGALDSSRRRPFPGMQVYLEDIRSPFNVGSMFRTAESFGVEKLWLSSLCADPRHKRAQRTAMGCVDVLTWERLSLDPFAGPEETLALPMNAEISATKETKAIVSSFSDCPIFALETGGIPLAEFPFPSRGILIAGSEELGVSPQALAAADSSLGRVTIPMYGAKGSLNVSVAFGIVMQAWSQRQTPICR